MKALQWLMVGLITLGTGTLYAQDTSKQQKKAKAQYECPMKCEPAKDAPGKCGKCGMDLKKVKAADHYACPMHPEEHGNKPGKCGKCGMELKKQPPGDSTYVCPMHADQQGNKPGKCGKCGMDMKKQS